MSQIRSFRHVFSSDKSLAVLYQSRTDSIVFIENICSGKLSICEETPYIMEQEVRVGQASKMTASLMYSPDLNVSSTLRPVQWSSIPQIVRKFGYCYWLMDIWK